MHEVLASLPVPFATYVVLTQFMANNGVRREMVDVVDEALKNWMDALHASKAAEQASTLNGYQWKHLFLPEGAKLRTICEGAHYIAHVEGCKLIYEGRMYSPSQFVNSIHGTCRNAWKTIWVQLPDGTDWTLANEYRGVHTEIRARKSKNKNKKARFRTAKTNRESETLELAGLRKLQERYGYLRTSGQVDAIDPLHFIDAKGDSLLHTAVLLDDLEGIEILLEAGHEVNCRGDMGTTPLHCAVSEAATALLLSFGASSNIRDDFGRLPGENSDGAATVWSDQA